MTRATAVLVCVMTMITLASTLSCAQRGRQRIRLETRDVSIGRLPSDIVWETIAVSPDGRRVGYGARSGDEWRFVCDGHRRDGYDLIGVVYFSADSRRVSYPAARDGKEFVVVDGVEGRAYERIAGVRAIFSPDSRRVAYVVGSGGQFSAVVDGEEGPRYGFADTPVFSPDSKRTAYWVQRNDPPRNAGSPCTVVVDGREGENYDGILNPTFSSDSKHLAYGAERDGEWFLVVDGREVNGRYERVDHVGFADDGTTATCNAQRGGTPVAVVGDEEYPSARWPKVSPDGRRVAYAAVRRDHQVAMVDGVSGPAYEHIWIQGFSPDSTRLAYSAVRGGRSFVAVDGREYRGATDHVVFSSDSKHVVYWALTSAGFELMVDGISAGAYDRPLSLDVLRGFHGLQFVFDSADSFYAVAVRNGHVLRTEVRIVEE
jgi:Tol biopolymer transport system component